MSSSIAPERKTGHPTHRPAHPTEPTASTGSANYTLIAEPDQGLTPIYNFISSATKTIEITMYNLTDTTVTSLLAAAQAKGVAVRVILDQNNEKANNTPAFDNLQAHGVAVHWANPVYLCTHQKTVTVDGAQSAIMTLNFQSAYYPTSRDFAVITNNAADIAAIQTTFNADFIDAAITPPTGENLVWSPTNSRASALAIIDGAAHSLLISQEEMADTGIESALESALKRGVSLTLAQENTAGKYNRILATLKADGAKIAAYTSSTGYYIHAKTVLADYGTAQAKLFVGSENFSTDSLDKNRELGIVINDPACMAGVHTAITADYNNGTKL
jgi:phosphatidylserine/phosphatidylglycerophosphate/cardiolipin synthase-like enzyme